MIKTAHNAIIVLTLIITVTDINYHVLLILLSSLTENTVTDQGFMQDKIIASHTCLGEHMDVNC